MSNTNRESKFGFDQCRQGAFSSSGNSKRIDIENGPLLNASRDAASHRNISSEMLPIRYTASQQLALKQLTEALEMRQRKLDSARNILLSPGRRALLDKAVYARYTACIDAGLADEARSMVKPSKTADDDTNS